MLSSFDKEWNKNFTEQLRNMLNKEEILASLTSLTNARNEFAHGGNPNITFEEVTKYFKDSFLVIEVIDNIINAPPSINNNSSITGGSLIITIQDEDNQEA